MKFIGLSIARRFLKKIFETTGYDVLMIMSVCGIIMNR